MASVSNGPVSTLPGHSEPLPHGATCDVHPERLAATRVQGETDSFGCEYNDLCKECLDELRAHAREAKRGVCDWCGALATDLRDRRDYDEGMSGRVYSVCGECVQRQNREIEEELSRYDDY